MALPKLEAARFSTELPISKKKVEYRPFLVREQKILLQALEGEDVKNITNSLYDLIKACVYNIDETELNINNVLTIYQATGKNNTIHANVC